MSKNLLLVLIIIWMIFIFIMSALPGSVSVGTTKKVINETLDKTNIVSKDELTEEKQQQKYSIFGQVHYYFRKTLHVSEYFVLAILIILYLGYYKLNNISKSSLTILICFIYSITDEIHQYFVPNRTPLFTDCLIDTSGAILACIIFIILVKVTNNKIMNYLKTNKT